MNIIKFSTAFPLRSAIRNENSFRARVIAESNSLLVDSSLARELYYLFNSLFGKVPAHVYSDLAAVRINDVAGTLYVTKKYDLNTTSPVDFIQSTTTNQPLWQLDADTGAYTSVFDGSNDIMDLADTAVFRNKSKGTVLMVLKDTTFGAGDVNHLPLYISANVATERRVVLSTRSSSNSRMIASGRRDDAFTTASSGNINSLSGFNVIAGLYNWEGNSVVGRINGTISSAGTWTDARTTTSDTASATVRIGARAASADRMGGPISEIILDNENVYTTDQITALRNLYRKYYPTLP